MADPSTASFWASLPRRCEEITITSVVDNGDSLTLTYGWTFNRSKAELGRDIKVGDRFILETVQLTRITGMQDPVTGEWLFHLTDEDLAADHRRFLDDVRRRDAERFELNRKQWAEQEAALPEWLQARIMQYRNAGGERFLVSGWGYELMICRLADLLDRGLEAEADKLACDEGVTGNQWDCAKALARLRESNGDEVATQLPAGIAPITGSADYS